MTRGRHRLQVGGRGGTGGSGKGYRRAVSAGESDIAARAIDRHCQAVDIVNHILREHHLSVYRIDYPAPFHLLIHSRNGSKSIIRVIGTNAVSNFFSLSQSTLRKLIVYETNASKYIVIVTPHRGIIYCNLNSIEKNVIYYKDTKPLEELVNNVL